MEDGRVAAGALKIIGGPTVPDHLVRLRGSGPYSLTGKVDHSTQVVRVFKNLRDFCGRKSFQCPDFRVELHLGGARMSSDNLPSIVKFLEIHRRIAHHLLLGIGESD